MTKPKAIIVDIDGTLAQKGDRSIYDYSKVHLDEPIGIVIEVVQHFAWETMSIPRQTCGCCYDDEYVYDIIYVSGREDSCSDDTGKWLKAHCHFKENSHLFMRKTGDNRCDTIIKREIYEEHIKNNYDVVAVFDDRPKVVRMWRELGLFVFNCCQHDKEF